MLDEVIIRILTLVLGISLIASSSTFLVDIAEKIMKKYKISELSIGFILLSVATSSPELSVAMISALQGVPGVSIGDILGSNVANITIILGLPFLLAGSEVVINEENLVELADVLFFATMIPLSLYIGGWFTRLTGIFLIIIYLAYNKVILSRKRFYPELEELENFSSKVSPFDYITIVLCIGGLILGVQLT